MKTYYIETTIPPFPSKGTKCVNRGNKMPNLDYLSPCMVDLRTIKADSSKEAIKLVKDGHGHKIL